MAELPSGTATFLLTDVEGSTLIVERHGAAGTEALIRHHAIVREIAEANGGRLNLQSAVNEETSFAVSFPLVAQPTPLP